MVLDRPDREGEQAGELAEQAAGVAVWAAIDPVRVPVGTASAQAAGLKYHISGAHPVLL